MALTCEICAGDAPGPVALVAGADRDARVPVDEVLAIAASLDPATVAQRLVGVVARVAGAAEACLYLFDEESQELVAAAAGSGVPLDRLGPVRVALGDGAIGWVGASREPQGVGAGGDDGPDGSPPELACMPLVAPGDRLVGVLAVWAQPGQRLDRDRAAALERLAPAAAVALEQARRHATVTRRARALERVAEVAAMTTAGIPTARMLDFVTEVARDLVGAEVAVTLATDPAGGDRIAVRTADPGASADQRRRVQAVRRELLAVDAQIRRGGNGWPVAAESISARLRPWLGAVATVPLRVAGEELGVLCCLRTEDERFTGEDHSVLTTVASQASLALKNALLGAERSQQQNEFGAFVRDLTAGRLDAGLIRVQAAALGLDGACGHRFAVAALAADDRARQAGGDRALAIAQLGRGLAELAPDARHAAGPREVVALLPERPDGDRLGELRARLARLAETVGERTGVAVTFGVSQPTECLDDLRAALTEAREVVAAGAGAGPVLTLDDVSHRLLLRRAADYATDGDRYSTAIDAIAEYDRVNGSELLHTLEIFLHVRSRSEAARALYVHRNTLAQRLRRIEELTGLAASDSEEWFPLQLALEIHLLRHPRGPAR
ncbi:MAG: GAF domain-containing protein [Solirubrobacterales bacterium]|nr:GAF domain-containing protein [Solirubrobacterales bacterium]